MFTSQAVLNYYCSARDVNIDNFSYSILKMKQEQSEANNFFCGAMQDKVMRLLLERDSALAAVENKNQNKDVKVKPLSESFIKKKQDELSNNFFYEILQDKITNLLQGRSV